MCALTNGVIPGNIVPAIGLKRPTVGKNMFRPKTDKYILQQLEYPFLIEKDVNIKLFDKQLFDKDYQLEKGRTNAFNKSYSEFLDVVKTKDDNKKLFSIDQLFDKENKLEDFLKVKSLLSKAKLSYNQSVILNNEGMLKYIFCRKVFSDNKFKHPKAIANSILDKSSKGILSEINVEIIKGSIAQIIKDRNIETGPDGYFGTANSIMVMWEIDYVSYKADSFIQSINEKIQHYIFNESEIKILNKVSSDLNINPSDYQSLISYMKKSSIKIDDKNAAQYLSIALHHLKNDNLNYGVQSTDASADLDFSVTYFEDDAFANEIVRENIECSAQLFYVMTLMDELEIFNAVHHIISKYLPSGNVDVRDRDLLQDLQLYTFNEEFRDLKNGRIYKKTRTEERHMFYQQVFNYGSAAVMDGMIRNSDFNHLWESLLLAAIEYIDKSEDSENQAFVSTQKIIQAVEDLQYNLSSHCTGMSKVAAPIINKELTFVVERILKNKEIATQINPMSSASFWKLVEKVVGDMRGRLPNVSALRNKAIFGHKILHMIANFVPGFLDDETRFLDFISTIEAFIIANSQLEAQYNTSNDEDDGQDGLDEFEYMDTGENADDWDF